MIAIDGGIEVRILMMPPNRTQDHLRKARPEVRIDVHLGLPGQALEVDPELVCEAAAVQGPVASVQRAAEVEHHALDLRPRPQGLDHLRLCRCRRHISTSR
jgi:hypothetical protein